MINVPDSLDICPDTLGYARILRIFTRIVWKGTFFWHIRCDRSDRSNPVTAIYHLRGVKQSKSSLLSPFCHRPLLSFTRVLPLSTFPSPSSLHWRFEVLAHGFFASSLALGLKGRNRSVVKLFLKFLTSSSLFQGITCFPCPIS